MKWDSNTDISSREIAKTLKLQGLTYREIGNLLKISRQRAQQLTSPRPWDKEEIKKRSNGLCDICGDIIDNGHIHHNIEGYDALNNLQYLCLSCHMKQHDNFKRKEPITISGNLKKYLAEYENIKNKRAEIRAELREEIINQIKSYPDKELSVQVTTMLMGFNSRGPGRPRKK